MEPVQQASVWLSQLPICPVPYYFIDFLVLNTMEAAHRSGTQDLVIHFALYCAMYIVVIVFNHMIITFSEPEIEHSSLQKFFVSSIQLTLS